MKSYGISGDGGTERSIVLWNIMRIWWADGQWKHIFIYNYIQLFLIWMFLSRLAAPFALRAEAKTKRKMLLEMNEIEIEINI